MNFLVSTGLPFWREAIRGIGALLCNLIYSLISWVYQLFMTVAKLNFLSTTAIEPIYQRITMILTIVMTFYITFEFVKYVINPDNITDKEKGVGNILYRMVLVVVLIAFVPKLFTLAYRAQNIILNNQVISKIILGKKNVNVETAGGEFSANLLSLFYGIDEEACANNQGNCSDAEDVVTENLDNLSTNGSVNILEGINVTVEKSLVRFDDSYTPAIKFSGFFAIGVGLFVLYVLVLYSVDVGIRYAQLLFLQIMAPIAIMGYILPKKDGIFQKWTKQCLTTYLDLFIRIAIIYFALFLIQIIGSAYDSGALFEGMEISKLLQDFAYIVLIIGLLTFASRAPKLLNELLPSKGAAGIGFGFKAGERVGSMTARAMGATLGATKTVGAIGRRAIANHNRNRVNGQKSLLTHEGREQAKQRRANRRKARNLEDLSERSEEMSKTENDLKLANRKLKDARARGASQEEINRLTNDRDAALSRYQKARGNMADLVKADKELADARARGASQEEINRLTNQRNDIKERVNTSGLGQNEIYQNDFNNFQATGKKLAAANAELKAAQNSGDANRLANAIKNQATAKAEFDAASNKMNDYAMGEAITRKEFDARNQELNDIADRRNNARTELENAIASGDNARITKAQKEYGEAEKAYNDFSANYLNAESIKDANRRQQFVEDLKPRIESAREQVVEDSNTAYKSFAGAVLGGVGAGVKATVTGATATKLEDVTKKASEAAKKDIKYVNEMEKYYDAGGAGGIEGTINRTVQQIEKGMGIETQYQRTVLENKAKEPKIKNLEAKSSLTKDIKSTADSAEDRLKDKIDELSQVLDTKATIKTGLKNADGTDQLAEIGANETIGDLHRKYVGRAERTQAEADSAAKRVEEFESANSILSQNRANLNDTDKARYDVAKAQADLLRNNAETKAKDAADAKFAVSQIQKNAARYQFTSIIKDISSGMSLDDIKNNRKYDKVAVEKVQDFFDSIKVAKQNPEVVEDLRKRLISADFDAFMSGRIADFEQLDRIKTAAINSGNQYERDLKAVKEEKRANETSNRTAAEKAASDFNGSK